MRPLPTKNELLRIQHLLLRLWAGLKKKCRVRIDPQHGPLILVVYSDKLGGFVASSSVALSDAFKDQVHKTLTADDVVRRFRFCHRYRRPICRQKTASLLLIVMLTSDRTQLWREKNREQFRASRRAAYKRKFEKALGTLSK